MKKKLRGKTTNEEKTTNEKKPQMKKKNKNEEKPQMKKTNVENFKGVTHDIEFMFFSAWRFALLAAIVRDAFCKRPVFIVKTQVLINIREVFTYLFINFTTSINQPWVT